MGRDKKGKYEKSRKKEESGGGRKGGWGHDRKNNQK